MTAQIRVLRTPPRLAPSPGSLAASFAAETTEPPPRGLKILNHVPFGHNVCLAKDDRMAPLVRAGEIVIYQEGNCLPEHDQLFVVEYAGCIAGKPGGPTHREVVEVHRTGDDEHWWSTSARRAKTEEDHARHRRQRIFVPSDGPYQLDRMMDRLIGRVVGIYQPKEVDHVS